MVGNLLRLAKLLLVLLFPVVLGGGCAHPLRLTDTGPLTGTGVTTAEATVADPLETKGSTLPRRGRKDEVPSERRRSGHEPLRDIEDALATLQESLTPAQRAFLAERIRDGQSPQQPAESEGARREPALAASTAQPSTSEVAPRQSEVIPATAAATQEVVPGALARTDPSASASTASAATLPAELPGPAPVTAIPARRDVPRTPRNDEPAREAAPDRSAEIAELSSKTQAGTMQSTAVTTPETATSWTVHVSRALKDLERELERADHSSRNLRQLATSQRLLQLVSNQRELAAAEIEELPEGEREFWKHQFHALSVAVDANQQHADSRRFALALRELDAARKELANLSSLDVRNLVLCQEVTGFGVYTPFNSSSFKPGQELLLYVEVENFSVAEADGKFKTELQAEYHLVQDGTVQSSSKLPLVTESNRNRRRDYFVTYRLVLPENLAKGKYTLQLVVEDVIGRKSSQGSLDFQIR